MAGYIPRSFSLLFLALLCGCLSGCAALLTSTVIRPAVDNLQYQTDIALVCEGAPAFLLMLDSMLVSSPKSRGLLLTASQSYSAYAAVLEECGAEPTRIAATALRAKEYGQRLLHPFIPLAPDLTEDQLAAALARLRADQVPMVFWGTYGWLSWIKTENGSPAALADTVIIEKIMRRLLELDEGYHSGAIHLFFGAYYAARPALLGGRPDLARRHFEQALTLSERQFLLVQTTYAETFARATMDGELHDRLLREVVSFPVDSVPERALSNQLAINRAARLLAEEYFAE